MLPVRRLTAPGLLAIALLLAAFAGTASATEPVLTIDPPTAGYTTAKASGTIDPGGNQMYYSFEYVQDPTTEAWTVGTGAGGEEFSPLPSSSGTQAVSKTLFGLKPDTEYKVRLVAILAETGEFKFTGEPYETITTKHIAVPAITQDPVSAITTTTAHFSGTINANAPDGSLAADQEAAYETSWHFECEPTCPGASQGVIKPGEAGYKASEAGKTVAFDATGLETNTTYQVKLVATNSGGAIETVAERIFSTPLVVPAVQSAAGAPDGQSGYTIEGVVNPLGSKITNCHFEYGPTAAYVFQAPCSPVPVGRNEVQEVRVDAFSGDFNFTFRGQKTADIPWTIAPTPDNRPSADEFKAALETLSTIGPGGIASVTHQLGGNYVVTFGGPLGEANLSEISGENTNMDPQVEGGRRGGVFTDTKVEGGNNAPIAVEAHLTGLTPGATYHFQLVASNGAGPSSSGDRIFVPTLDPAQPPCPNEAVRKENNSLALPECRAYEQISSPNKLEFQAYLNGYFEGASVVYENLNANISNSGSGGAQNYYVANRTSTGWETVPNLNGPSGSPFAGPGAMRGYLQSYAQNLQSSYWAAYPVGQLEAQNQPYLRGPDGRYAQIGTKIEGRSALYGATVVGSTPDLSQLVLDGGGSIGGAYGPGVYEFDGTGNGAPHRIDLNNSGQPVSECPDDAAEGKALSRDGRTVFFRAIGDCGAAGPAATEIWARVDGDTDHPVSYNASESHCTRLDCNAPAPARYLGSALDGSSVFFVTAQQLVNEDTDEGNDLYVYRLPTSSEPNPTPALSEITGAPGGSGLKEEEVGISDDGSSVLFVATGVLASNEGGLGDVAKAGDRNLYLWRRDAGHPAGQTTFLGRLLADDLFPRTQPGVISFGGPQMTPDGRYVVLATASPLLPTDTDNARDVYRYDVGAGVLTRLSTSVAGTGGNVDGATAEISSNFGGATRTWQTHPAIADDGQAIVFATTDALSPLDGNGGYDIYLWKEGHVHRISAGVGALPLPNSGAATEVAIDGSGQDIYFTTREALSPSDGDGAPDIYDARIGGGFSFGEPAPCAGEACQPAGPGAPSSPNPATDRPRTPELPAGKSCPKGKILKKGKCVKKAPKKHHKKKHKQGKRSAKGDRGGAK